MQPDPASNLVGVSHNSAVWDRSLDF